MNWPLLGIWAVVVTALCGLAIVLLVGEAFRRTGPSESPGKLLAGLILSPGLKLAGESGPAAILAVAWFTWLALGAAVLALAARFG